MNALILRCRDGDCTFAEFAEKTLSYWRRAADDLLGRWDHPAAIDCSDLIQEMLIAAWRSMERVDPTRGDPKRYIVFAAVKAVRRWFHRQRGAYGYARSSGKNRSPEGRYPIGIDWYDDISIDGLSGASVQERAVEMHESMLFAETERDRLILEEMWRTASIDVAARKLCEFEAREKSDVTSRRLKAARHDVRQVMGRIAAVAEHRGQIENEGENANLSICGELEKSMLKQTEAKGGVNLKLVKADVVKRRLSLMGLSSDGTIEEIVLRLVNEYKRQYKEGELTGGIGKCDDCGGYSDLRIDGCPYCGAADTDDKTESKFSKSDESPIDAAANTIDNAAKKPKSDRKQKAEIKHAVSKPSSTNKAKSKPAPKTSKVLVSDVAISDLEIDEKSSATVSIVSRYTETDLDAAIARLNQATLDTAVGLVTYCSELKNIHENELWKLRADGTMHKTFELFCKNELGISRSYAYQLITISSNYTLEQLSKFGFQKLRLALQVPPELRSKLLGDGSDTVRTMSDRARQLAGKETKSRQPPAADKARAVMVAIVPGIIEVPMQARPNEGAWPAGKPTRPAKSLKDDPWFRLAMSGNVFLTVRITHNDKGEIIAIVEHRCGIETA